MHEFNVQATVVELVRADNALQAVDVVLKRLAAAGFQPHVDVGKQDAFHSETCDCEPMQFGVASLGDQIPNNYAQGGTT